MEEINMMNNLITETMLLPSSASKIYGENFDGHITLRAMTTREERMRLSAQSFYPTMAAIINECIVDNKRDDGSYKINSEDLTDFDFFAICVKLRIISYGNKYKTKAVCPTCGHQFDFVADLSEILYNFVPEDFTEPYMIGPLPKSGDTLGCRLLRVRDRIAIDKEVQSILTKNPKYQGDPSYTLEMQKRIVSVNGQELDFITAPEYVDNMIAMDNYVYHEQVKRDFGVIRFNTTECQNPLGCGQAAVWVLKPDAEFFRPCLDS